MSNITDALVLEANRRLFDESVVRIKKCLNELSEDEIWNRPNASLSSIGNLVLHLCGNVTQWIGTGLGKQPDNRIRDLEFEPDSRVGKTALIKRLDQMEVNTRKVLDQLTETELLAVHRTQGFEENGLSIMVHVIEHFSYHTGQITWQTKLLKNKDMGYYGNLDLNVTD